ncbi:MAG: TRAP transporter substrate-binding protein DctP, partial [Myxococcales bacterium]|nr:TRAP transporter substrate-binding protein DctP [Myxococcales bacterium]
LATLAPRRSVWARALERWDRELQARTGGRVRLQVFAGGAAGDEVTVVRKLRAGQLDAAALTTTGLGHVVRPVFVLQAPGLLRSYAQLDAVRRELAPELEAQFAQAGLHLVGWADVGLARLFSAHRLQRPADLVRTRPWAWRDNPIFEEVLREAGARGVALALPEVLVGLQTGRIDTFAASALAAVGLQWYPYARFVSEEPIGVVLGALVVRADRWAALPVEAREAFAEAAARHSAQGQQAVREQDERAYRAILARGLEAVPTGPARAEWEALGRRARARLTGRLWPAELLARVERIAAAHAGR